MADESGLIKKASIAIKTHTKRPLPKHFQFLNPTNIESHAVSFIENPQFLTFSQNIPKVFEKKSRSCQVKNLSNKDGEPIEEKKDKAVVKSNVITEHISI